MLKSAIYMAFLCTIASSATAQTVLTVTKNDTKNEYSSSDLDALPQTEYRTKNSFMDSDAVFSGPLLRDVLELSDLLNEENIIMRAINEYEIKFPVSDATNYDVIIATRMNGDKMSVRERGPLWIMYPISDHPELNNPIYDGRLIWQLDEVFENEED